MKKIDPKENERKNNEKNYIYEYLSIVFHDGWPYYILNRMPQCHLYGTSATSGPGEALRYH
jgi:hypothetical protein